MHKIINSVVSITFVSISLLQQGCVVLDSVLKAGESGSESYAVVKNANSFSKVSDGIVNVTESLKIKAKTTKGFVKTVGVLISAQPLNKQAELISQSIEAKVTMAKNTRSIGIFMGMLILAGIFGALVIIRFLLEWISPKPKTKTQNF